MRFMADAISCASFPTGPIAIPNHGVQPIALRAGYINGTWPTAGECGTDVSIDVNGGASVADVLDIEKGDATPDTAPGWVRAHNSHGGFPAVLYCNRSTRPAVASACAAAGLVAGRDFFWWIATLDGTETVPDMTGVLAVQVWSANFFNSDIDVSIVYDDSFKGDGPAPSPVLEDDMYLAVDPNGTVWEVTDFTATPIQDATRSGAWQKLTGKQPVPLSMDEINAIDQSCGEAQMKVGFDKIVTAYPYSDRSGGSHTTDSDDLTGHVLSIHAVTEDTATALAAVAAKVAALSGGTVDPAALAAALLADTSAVAKLGDAIAAGLVSRLHP